MKEYPVGDKDLCHHCSGSPCRRYHLYEFRKPVRYYPQIGVPSGCLIGKTTKDYIKGFYVEQMDINGRWEGFASLRSYLDNGKS